MKTTKRIAVYMDHFMANLIEYNDTAKEVKTIKSDFNHFEKEKILQKGESHLHNKEQDMQNEFYKKIIDEILKYNEVLLFGFTTAKTELMNILNDDNNFRSVKITIKNTDELTKNQQISFVNECFYID
ncbi:hypothetical protein [Flavobacterium sp.]|uniref:hypothetical protein n=1 Tax=Flavobacterium sp. TaxID=239 RepID=UPI00286E2B3F|nr:hypothetical protein [Flavobacterium sp.]